MTHLECLELHLSNERIRLANTKSKAEAELKTVWCQQLEREIEGEKDFLQRHGQTFGVSPQGTPQANPLEVLDDDSLLAELLK